MDTTTTHDVERVLVPAWAWALVALAVAFAYLLTLENGALLRASAGHLHELFHDGRHFLGVPCH